MRTIARWEFGSDLDPHYELEDHVGALIERLRSVQDKIAALPSDWDRVMSAVIHIDGDDMPPIHLEPSLVRALAEFDCTLDVDLYVSS